MRVRVAVRLRPRNAEESIADTDFADCVELQPEVLFFSLSFAYHFWSMLYLFFDFSERVLLIAAKKVEAKKEQLGMRNL